MSFFFITKETYKWQINIMKHYKTKAVCSTLHTVDGRTPAPVHVVYLPIYNVFQKNMFGGDRRDF